MTRLITYFNSLNKILDDKEIKYILKTYNEWVKYQPSIIDGNENVGRPHHVRTSNNAGTGVKPNDLWCVPITYEQHDKQERYGAYQEIFLERLPELHERFLEEHPEINKLTHKWLKIN